MDAPAPAPSGGCDLSGKLLLNQRNCGYSSIAMSIELHLDGRRAILALSSLPGGLLLLLRPARR